MVKLVFIFLSAFLLSCTSVKKQRILSSRVFSSSCHHLLETISRSSEPRYFQGRLFETNFSYKRIKSKKAFQAYFKKREERFGDAVYIGVGLDGHMYLVAGNYRFDGEIFMKSSTVSQSASFESGIVLEVSDRTGKLRLNLWKQLNRYQRMGCPFSYTCVSSACHELARKCGLSWGGADHMRSFYPHKFIEKFITRGIEHSELNVNVQIFTVGARSFERVFEQVEKSMEQRKRFPPFIESFLERFF